MKQEIATVLSNPIIAKGVPSVTVASGLIEYFDLFRSGVSLAAVIIGAMVSLAIWRKQRADRAKTDLETEMMEYEFAKMKIQDAQQNGRRADDKECQGNG